MIVLGLDPGLATVGYGVLRMWPSRSLELLGAGVISTPAHEPLPARLVRIREDLACVLGTYQPQAAAVELLYFTRNVKTAISVAQARGVILEQLWSAGLQDISEYTPTMVKQVLVGTGTASKANVQALVSQILGLSGVLRPDDVADAVAIALVRCRQVRALPEVAN